METSRGRSAQALSSRGAVSPSIRTYKKSHSLSLLLSDANDIWPGAATDLQMRQKPITCAGMKHVEQLFFLLALPRAIEVRPT